MKKTIISLLMVTFVALSMQAQTTAKKVYDEEINQLEQIDKAVAEAKASGKFVIAQVGGNWCPWCLRFADFITKDNEIAQTISDNFVYIHVNYNPRRSEEKTKRAAEMLKRLNSPQRFGFPVFVVLDEQGKVLHHQDSSYLEEGQGYDKEKVMRFFKNWTPQAVKE